MKYFSSTEQLNDFWQSSFGEKLPNDDEGMFIINAAMLMSSNIITFSEFMNGIGISEYDLKIRIPNSNAQLLVNEAKKVLVKHICDVKGFRGFKKKKLFAEWLRQMQLEYKKNSEMWTEEIKKYAFRLINVFTERGMI